MGRSEEEDDDEPKGSRRRRSAPSAAYDLGKVMQIARMVAWGALFLAVGCGGLLFCGALSRAESAPQEAAVGATFATAFIGLYILTRCVDSFLEGAERVRPKEPLPPHEIGDEE